MAIDAKIDLIRVIEKNLSDIMAVNSVTVVMKAVADSLQFFSVVRDADTNQQETLDMLEAFLSAKRIEGRTEKTIERYRYVINKVTAYIHTPTRQVTVYHLRNYIDYEKSRGLKDSTLEGLREVMSAYYGWLWRENLINSNPAANLGTIKTQKVVKKVYSSVDLERLRQSCKTKRDRAIVYFLYATGCRISEVTKLNRDDINLATSEIIVDGKGRKERNVYIDAVTADVLKSYLSERVDNCPALFVNRNFERITPGGIRVMLSKLAKEAGVSHVHPHKFRRTKATDLISRGMPVETVAHILGHSKLDTTMGYVVLNNEDIKQAYKHFT